MSGTPKPPNILIFMTDQQQACTVEPGHPCQTPAIRRLAAEGIRFSRAYTPTPMCAPARASLMTSLYAHAHGMLNNNHVAQAMRTGLNPGVSLWSERLKESGYQMHFAGKWHVSRDKGPSEYGWQEPDEESKKKAWLPWPTPGARSKQHWIRRPGWKPYELYGSVQGGPEQFSEYKWTQYARGKVKELAARSEPWCLYLGTHGPHDPFSVPEEYVRRYEGMEIPKPASFDDSMADKPAIYRRLKEEVWGGLTWDDYAETIRHYWAYNSFIDDQFAGLMATLEETGQADDTLVLYLSDHGEMMGSHGLFYKGVMAFEECYRVPLIMRWPRGIKAGQVCQEFVTLMDIGPTLLEITGSRPLETAHGRSLTPLWKGQTPADWPQEFYGQYHGSELYSSQRVLTTKRHKYVFNGFDYDELYDLEEDPGEMKNLNASPAHRPLRDDLIRRLWARAGAVGDAISCHGYPSTDLLPIGPFED